MITCASDFVNIDDIKIVDDATELLPLEGSKSEVCMEVFGFPVKNGKYTKMDKKKQIKEQRCILNFKYCRSLMNNYQEIFILSKYR